MGNSQSHCYADHQRGLWARKSPSHVSGHTSRRRTRSLVDEYLPDYGLKPKPLHAPPVKSVPSKGNSHKEQETRVAADFTPDPRFFTAPMPPSMDYIRTNNSSTTRGEIDNHVHFENRPVHGPHHTPHDRPRTPYPEAKRHT